MIITGHKKFPRPTSAQNQLRNSKRIERCHRWFRFNDAARIVAGSPVANPGYLQGMFTGYTIGEINLTKGDWVRDDGRIVAVEVAGGVKVL
jgi:hypothetical protein